MGLGDHGRYRGARTTYSSTPEDTCASLGCAMYANTVPVVYFRLYTPPLLVSRRHLAWSGYEQACVGVVYGLHGSYGGAQTGQELVQDTRASLVHVRYRSVLNRWCI